MNFFKEFFSGIKDWEKVLLSNSFLLLLMGVYFAFTNQEFFNGTYTKEDGLIEWLSVVALVYAAGVSVYRAVAIAPLRSKYFRITMIVMACVFIFGAGEEISWGQRIFGIQSSEFFLANNSQGETNLHNLVVGGKKINKIIFGTFLGICVATYTLIIPQLYRRMEKVKLLIDKWGVPIPRNYHVLSYLLLFIIVSNTPSPKKGELLEFGGCVLFVLMILNPLNYKLFQKN